MIVRIGKHGYAQISYLVLKCTGKRWLDNLLLPNMYETEPYQQMK